LDALCSGVNRLLLCLQREAGREEVKEGGRALELREVQALVDHCTKEGGLDASLWGGEGQVPGEGGEEGGLQVAWNVLVGYLASVEEF